MVLPDDLSHAVNTNPVLAEILENWDKVALPNCWIVAGAVVQSYWNAVHGYSPVYGIRDIDLIYFDPDDLSESAESGHRTRIAALFGNVTHRFDVKNEARVHLWYEGKFGYPIAPYESSESAIDTFPTTAGCIGVRPARAGLESYASFGFGDLLDLVVRPNKRQITRRIYDKKASRWQELWPQLKIIEWDDEKA